MTKLEQVRKAMGERELPSVLVSDMANVGWLTGFTGSAGRVLVTPSEALFITDSRYTIQAQVEVRDMPSASFSTPTDSDDFLNEKAKELGIGKLGFESSFVTYAGYERMKERLKGIELVPAGDMFGKFRMVKTPEELAKIEKACAAADQTFEYMLGRIQVGRSEYDVNLDLEFYIRRQGMTLAFPPIVVSGENSARPHGHASQKTINEGDFITMDFGAGVDLYCSDLTRTVVAGKASDRHREVYEQVLKAQLAALDAMKPGALARDIDAIARKVLDEKDLAKYFGHGLGHGLGRVVHDTGRMNSTSEDVFEPGQVWTVEPGVYIEGFGGVRIEDDVVITEDGIRILTKAPKHLIELTG